MRVWVNGCFDIFHSGHMIYCGLQKDMVLLKRNKIN